MRRRLCHLACCVLILACATAIAEDPFSYHTRAGEWAFAQGDLDLAAQHFRQALEAAQALPEGDRRLEDALGNLARVEERLGRLDEAQPLYELLIAAREARVGRDHPSLLDPLVSATRVAVASGDVPAAKRLLDRYLDIAESTGAADPDQLHRMLLMRARMHVLAEEPDDALPLLRRAAEVVEQDPHATSDDVVDVLRTLSDLEMASGDPEAGAAAASRAAAQAESPAEAATILSAAARSALGAGHVDVAADLAHRAIEVDRHRPPVDALAVLAEIAWTAVRTSTDTPAALLGAGTGDPRLTEAETRLEELLQARPDAARSADPEAVTTLRRLVAVTAMAGKAGSAAAWQRMLVDVDPRDPDPRRQLVDLLAASGRNAEAAVENAVLVDLLEERHGPDDPRLLPPLERQEELLRAAGEKKAAKKVHRRVKQLRKSLR